MQRRDLRNHAERQLRAAPCAARALRRAAFYQSGSVLTAGQAVLSCDGAHSFVMQSDGNLVLYHGAAYTWNSGTFGHPGALVAMQGDGNLVLTIGGQLLWNSGSFGHPGASLSVQGDGNVVIYDGPTPVWWTGTSGE